ncbi:hypothetical protein AL035_15265 [Salipiger aestuarii]|nr:hypothetical protein AL035_15265 [Salipiger aestuarii]
MKPIPLGAKMTGRGVQLLRDMVRMIAMRSGPIDQAQPVSADADYADLFTGAIPSPADGASPRQKARVSTRWKRGRAVKENAR